MASGACTLHKASPAPGQPEWEILGAEVRNLRYVDLRRYWSVSQDEMPSNGFTQIVGSSRALRSVLDHVEIVAPTDSRTKQLPARNSSHTRFTPRANGGPARS